MLLSMKLLDEIRANELPVPGSINFTNAQDQIEVPIYKTIGMISTGVEGDPSGMESGPAEIIRELITTLVFYKNVPSQCWNLVHFTEADVRHAMRVITDRTEKRVREQISKEQGKTETAKPVGPKKKK